MSHPCMNYIHYIETSFSSSTIDCNSAIFLAFSIVVGIETLILYYYLQIPENHSNQLDFKISHK